MLGVTNLFSANDWVCLRVPGVEVYSSAGESIGRRVLAALELGRLAIPARNPVPVRVVVFGTSGDFGRVVPDRQTAGFFVNGPGRDYIALDSTAGDVREVTLHEYTHLVLSHNGAVLPLWLNEGLSEFYATVRVESGWIVAGRPIERHLRLLAGTQLLDAGTMAGAGKDTDLVGPHARRGLFYAQSWALAHMLNLSPRYGPGMEKFAEALKRGEGGEEAFREAFGRTLTEAVRDLRLYVPKVAEAVRVGQFEPVRTEVEVRRVSAAEGELLGADLLSLQGRWEEGAALFRRAAARNPEAPEALAGLAGLALREKRYAEARALLEKALSAGEDGGLLYEYAMVLRETGADRAQVMAVVRRALNASPAHAEAHFLLGTWLGDQGDSKEAIEHLRKAAELRPDQLVYWHGLAWAYSRAGNLELSRNAARRAMALAITEPEIEMASAALSLSAANRPAKLSGSQVRTPSSWDNVQGDARIEGRMTLVECGATVRLHVEGLVLEVADPGKVVLEGTRGVSAELRCGPQSTAVAMEYKRATRAVTKIVFR